MFSGLFGRHKKAREGKGIEVNNSIDVEKALYHCCMKVSQIANIRAEKMAKDDVVINGKILLTREGKLYRILDGTVVGANDKIFEVISAKRYAERTGVPVYEKLIRITKEMADKIVINSMR